MAPLSEDEIQRIATDTQNAIASTEFACASLTRVFGGSTSFVFRGDLVSPLSLRGGSTLKSVLRSVIVKKATDFAAVNSDFTLDPERSVGDGTEASLACV
jgi:hypothetical protein